MKASSDFKKIMRAGWGWIVLGTVIGVVVAVVVILLAVFTTRFLRGARPAPGGRV